MYLTTLTLRPCLEMVVSTSPALLLQGRLWGGHQEVMALKSSCRSSFWASSSAGDTKVQSFTRIWEREKRRIQFIHSLMILSKRRQLENKPITSKDQCFHTSAAAGSVNAWKSLNRWKHGRKITTWTNNRVLIWLEWRWSLIGSVLLSFYFCFRRISWFYFVFMSCDLKFLLMSSRCSQMLKYRFVRVDLQLRYLDKYFLEQRPAVSRRQLWRGGTLARRLLLAVRRRRWRRRRLWGGAYGGLGHVGQIEEQVEAFDQRGGNGHGRHAVHCFLLRSRQDVN